ncbi:MAG TPA: twin-arginine translocase subunit TatC [Gemmatimonadales bacterium]|nr:twin-arginine translocase subunit TatC [Gemmatimonadales bacterium]
MAQTASGAEMPFLDHLEELRHRILKSLGALVVGVVIAFTLITKYKVVEFLARPVLPFLMDGQLVYTGPADAFKIVMGLSFALGLIIALPVVLWQLWAFISPGLYRHEKRVVVPMIFFATLLFMGGVALSYLVILPLTLRFLLSFQSDVLAPFITASGYFGMATSMSLAFGAVFELPIIILALTALGIVTPQMLHKFRRHAVIVCVVLAAFITPGGDPISLAAMSIPLYLLYEFSVVVSEVIYRLQRRKAAKAAADDAAGAVA